MKRILLTLLAITALVLFASIATAQTKAQPKAGAQASTEKPYELTDDITPPRLLEVANPEYTDVAKKKKIEGSVVLDIVVDKKGNVVEAKVKKGLGYGLDESAVAAVKVWLYKPAEKDGQPVPVHMEVTTDFYMHE
ncbi:MAG TPA: energy transducer TonB [Candidatus Acidoferrales bacterium]|nr:energy transducer TonB [Candidatus Acidoferrales bacterium]